MPTPTMIEIPVNPAPTGKLAAPLRERLSRDVNVPKNVDLAQTKNALIREAQ